MGSISVVINTLNEEENLPQALASIKSLADEIVVVDMHSTDKTVEIARGMGAKVYVHPRTGYVEPARNFAISKAVSDWILILDADETISVSLRKSLRKLVSEPSADYYRLPRKNIIFGKWIKHSRWWPDYNIRFFKKGYVSWNEMIHSVPLTKGKGYDLPANDNLAITHYHYKSIEQYIDRMNRYSSKYAKTRHTDGYKFKSGDLIKKPMDEFLSRYFYGKGYKDGIHGLALAFLQAFFELTIYLKVWQLENFKKKKLNVSKIVNKMKEAETDLHYWQSDTLFNEYGGLKNRIKRKLRV